MLRTGGVALLLSLPAAAQRVSHDAATWLPQQKLGTPVKLTMAGPRGKVYRGTVVFAGADAVLLQEKRGGWGQRTPDPVVLDYAAMGAVEEGEAVKAHHGGAGWGVVLAGVALTPLLYLLLRALS